MPGPVEQHAREEIAAAQERVASAQRSHDEYMSRIHFTGNSAQGYRLTESTLTDEEFEALKFARSGKDIPKKMIDSDHPGFLVGGGSVATVDYVATKCEEYGI